MDNVGNTNKIVLSYICKKCGEILHMEDVVKHLVTDHDPEWRGSFYDALEEYDRRASVHR